MLHTTLSDTDLNAHKLNNVENTTQYHCSFGIAYALIMTYAGNTIIGNNPKTLQTGMSKEEVYISSVDDHFMTVVLKDIKNLLGYLNEVAIIDTDTIMSISRKLFKMKHEMRNFNPIPYKENGSFTDVFSMNKYFSEIEIKKVEDNYEDMRKCFQITTTLCKGS